MLAALQFLLRRGYTVEVYPALERITFVGLGGGVDNYTLHLACYGSDYYAQTVDALDHLKDQARKEDAQRKQHERRQASQILELKPKCSRPSS